MNTPTTAVTRSILLSGRDFRAFLCGRIEISAHSQIGERLHIRVGDHLSGTDQNLFLTDQLIDVNQGDSPAPLELPFLDALPKPDFFAGCR